MNNLNSFQLNFYLLHLLQKFCVRNPLQINIRTVRGRESRDMDKTSWKTHPKITWPKIIFARSKFLEVTVRAKLVQATILNS